VLAFAAPSASAAPWFGFSDNAVVANQLSATQDANLAAQAGAASSRVTINWSWVQPTPTAPNFSTFDAIYNADLARGIHPLFVLTGAPAWTWASGTTCPSGTTCNYPPASIHNSDWQSIATQIAKRYPQLAGIEIWNEPNQSYAWWGGFDPARYTQLLKLAYTAIKAVAPSMPVIGGALATDLSASVTSNSYPAQLFLQAMYANGARGSMDGISLHPYPQSLDPWYAYKALSVITETRNANGDSVPLWVTETGMSTTSGFTTSAQSLLLGNLVPALLAYPGIAGVYVNALVEPSWASVTDPERGYGVMYGSLTPKPAYCALASAFHTGYTCPAGVSVPQPSATQTAHWQAENLLQAAANAALAWHKAHGTYGGLTSAGLNSLDPRLSATAPTVLIPGSTANPSQVGVWFLTPDAVLLCNASQAATSYCIFTQSAVTWIYGMATGGIYAAAYYVLHGVSNYWSGSSADVTLTRTAATTHRRSHHHRAKHRRRHRRRHHSTHRRR
jgi:hypothetical protein